MKIRKIIIPKPETDTEKENFEYLTESETDRSILAFLGKKIKFLFMPIGVNSWELSTSLLAGVFAKESIISTLSLLTKSGVGLNLPQTIAFIIFVMFYIW